MGAGLVRYHNEGLVNNKEFKATSNSLGGNFDFTFDYILFKNIAIGADVSFTGCKKIKKITLDGETVEPDKWNRMKFFRTDFSIGIKGYF